MNDQGNGRLNGKVAVVTGSSQGIGEAIAQLFAREGANVVVNSRTEEHVGRVVDTIVKEDGTAHGVTADVGTLGSPIELNPLMLLTILDWRNK